MEAAQMVDQEAIIDVLDARAKRREERRDFFRSMTGKAVVGGAAAAMAATSAEAQTAPSDNDILNFALNLEYLEAQFYSYASFGRGLDEALLSGTGTRGNVRPGREVPFTDITVRQYAREIATDEIAHVRFLRAQLGSAAVAQPEVDVSADVNGAFSSAARAAGLVGPGVAFDPYLNDQNFLLGAFIFEDVGVTGYKGAAPLITSRAVLEAAAGLLAVEAYHASIIRTTLYGMGMAMPMLRTSADAISNARDSLDGSDDRDQGISPSQGVPPTANASNVVPLDANGLAFSRTTGQVLNIIYLNRMAVTQGGFLPNGANGPIRTSAAN